MLFLLLLACAPSTPFARGCSISSPTQHREVNEQDDRRTVKRARPDDETGRLGGRERTSAPRTTPREPRYREARHHTQR